MKVLERGIPPAERAYITVCKTCKSKLQFFQTEGKITYDQRDGDYLSVTCPVCSGSVTCDLSSYVKNGTQ